MKTKTRSTILTCFAILGLSLPTVSGEAPRAINSLTIELTGTDATYLEDRGLWSFSLSKSDLESETFSYERSATMPNVGTLTFTDWMKAGNNELYSGTFVLTFESDSEGTYQEDYTGAYTGYVNGTFEIIAMDVRARPLAARQTVKVRNGRKTGFRLEGEGFDIGKGGLKYKIVRQPKVGKLIAGKKGKVTYKPKRGFKGTVKFKFIVKEGKTKSKPATVTLRVR